MKKYFLPLVITCIRSVSLDPDEDKRDTTIFDGLKDYMLNELTDDQCQHLKTVTLRNLAKRAQSLKALRPPRGLSFSLQQQRTFGVRLAKYGRFMRPYCHRRWAAGFMRSLW